MKALATINNFDRIATHTAKNLWHLIERCVGIATHAARQVTKAIIRAHRQEAYVRALQGLNDRTLKDIGLHRSEICSAVCELFDDAPPSRLRSPTWTARTEAIENAGAAANDGSFVERVSGHC